MPIAVGIFLFLAGFVLGNHFMYETQYRPPLNKCEAELPRNQECELIAVPASQGGEK